MADDAMFAPLAATKGAAGAAGTPARPKSAPIVPVPADAPPCTWRHPKHGAPVAMWPYYDVDGRLLGYTARVEHNAADGRLEKDVLPITYCRIGHARGDRHAWCACALPAPRPLYRLPELLTLGGSTVIITEGEKKADLVPGLFPGYCGTTSMGGANAAKHSDWGPLAGRNIIVWPDHDEPGTRYADDVAALAAAAGAASVAIVALPADWPEGWDLADPLPEDAVPEVLDELLQSAVPWTPPGANQPTTVADAAEIARLAALPLVTYGRERKLAAERLGCRVSILDRAVAAERGRGEAAPGRGRPLSLPEPEPWPQPVDGAELLDELAAAIRRHVVLDRHEADAVALWVLAVHAFDAWTIFPRLFVTAPEKGCGKSTLLDVLSRLIPKPLGASSITPASLFRTIETARPTMLLDEADTYARDNEDMRSVLDAGHRRDGAVIRTVGDNHEPRQFSAWAPVALAAIGHLPGTIEDRSIVVRLRRRRPDEPIESLRLARAGGLDELARKAARWVADHGSAFAAANPVMPAGIYNRGGQLAPATRGRGPRRRRTAGPCSQGCCRSVDRN
jgi:hypothetical protein